MGLDAKVNQETKVQYSGGLAREGAQKEGAN